MTYVIYNRATTRIAGKATGYKTPGAARAQITRWSNKWYKEIYRPLYPEVDQDLDPVFLYGYADIETFRESIEKKVVKTNMMTGEEYEESVNTPLHMSPSSETYWSM